MSILNLPILDKIKLQTSPSGRRPPAAVEIAPEGVLAASIAASGSAPVVAFAALQAGAVVPGIAEANLRHPEAVAEALRSVLDQVSPRSRSISIVVPDTSARVFVLDFDSLPAKAAEVLPILRFRLRKVVPFDVEHAAVSFQVLSQQKNAVKVLTMVMPSAILSEYENAVRAAGYEPGAVLPSALASLAATDTNGALLAANLSSTSLTTAITQGNDLLLYRTVELPIEPAERESEVQRGVAVAAAYFEDHLSAHPENVHYAGSAAVQEFAQIVEATQLPVVEIAPIPATGTVTTMGPMGFAGVAGALAGAA